ncbi:hydrogenase maturation protease [Anabaena sp. UHCC 0187]|uniref:hydrogenase maturation protease n=1 Tax=Anabaena sp. UHCC 0187 TaxID=2590018 RepID=UPI0014486227|nr:hydrogenase maturation protease [Anabaena sp. UHCC 0187]MTJ12311.1 hydrogenase maturation protease [Anabaena sp. UHCC 0187]
MTLTAIVIGYGNELRSDDAIGPRVANLINLWHLSNVQSLAVHQLTPELAANLANVNLAIFVDAMINSKSEDVQVEYLLPTKYNMITGHSANPQSLLALTKSLYGCYPAAWLVTVPGVNFELGDCLSPIAEKGIGIALTKIISIINKV